MHRPAAAALIAALVFTSAACAQEPPNTDPLKGFVALWPEGAPDATGSKAEDTPAIRVQLPPADKANGCGVVVYPGGGYGGLAMGHEGDQIADWLNERGIAAFVVRYRLGSHGYRHPVMLNDATRAVRWARHHAERYNVDPARLGIWGFSAGGHLASTVATHYNSDELELDATDPIDEASSRPDFAILAYPVITMDEAFTHMGSRRNLLGGEPSDELVEKMSNEKQVTKDTPPVFIFHTQDDPVVKVRNAIEFYAACVEHGVKAELHVYQQGRHGVGLAQNDPILRTWPDRLHDWLKLNQFVKDTP